MVEGDDGIALASEFPAVERSAWAALAGDVNALRTVTDDGIAIEVLYTAADAAPEPGLPGSPPFVRGRTPASTRPHGWDVRQVVDSRRGRGAALEELERGATSVLMRLRDEPGDIDGPLMAAVLDGVLFGVAPVILDAGHRWVPAAEALVEVWQTQGVDPATVSGSFGADPFGVWASDRSIDLDVDVAALAALTAGVAGRFPTVKLATIDGTRFHDAGASDVQELGYTIANAVATLRALPLLGLTAALGRIELRLAATADQFATIAKFRAARRLWARVAEIAGVPTAATQTPLHAMSSTAMMTRYDPAGNMLRTTMACFAAGVAGADAVTVLPYDQVSSPAGSELGRRLARNTQSVLAMESHIARVIDPAGGSWYVERLTDQMATAGWAHFQEVESAGGFRAAVEAGLVARRIDEVRARRQRDIDHRRAAITGVTEFPNLAEPSPSLPSAGDEPAADGSLTRHRWSGAFEAIRARVDAFAAGALRPSVMLATLGRPRDFTARAMFARNFFEVGGIATRTGPVTDDEADVVAAFDAQPDRVVCLCSSDAVYGELGASVVKALTAAGATRIYLAGGPPDLIGALTDAGVTHTITAGFDARRALVDLVDHLGIP